AALACLLALAPAPAGAVEIVSRQWSDPHPGVRLLQGRTRAPAADFHALYVDLCAEGVRLLATGPAAQRQTPSAWARAAGAQAAINGDFFRTDTATPVVYGLAVGGGRAWPAAQTGAGARYADEWYARRYGWIAFGPGWAEFDHTRWAKRNVPIQQGFHGDQVVEEAPPGAQALVSGFPELVTEGARHRCADPTADTCFPDRSDMRARHPRSAMGLSQDRRTLILVAVDGRSAQSAGMYGAELAWLMEALGAWQAFNLDGGGSSALWVQGPGVVSDPSDGSQRAVANHWGVIASGAGEPGSCPVGVTVEGCFAADPTGARCGNLVAELVGGVLGSTSTDVDGDGRADVCGRGAAGLWCHRAGDGGFAAARAFEVALSDAQGWADPSNGSTLRFGDLDGDGRADVCARANAGIRCWLGAPDGVGDRWVGPALSDDEGYAAPGRYAPLLL
ncbi:MAG: phosphodiester glycosidase family protein, partial [Myxococcales bacterium]|nr:phosphodiester glycosidase family protein [Myxococcales bacterium]